MARKWAVTMDAVEAQAPAMTASASNKVKGSTPGPPCPAGKFSPMMPSSDKAGRWQVAERDSLVDLRRPRRQHLGAEGRDGGDHLLVAPVERIVSIR